MAVSSAPFDLTIAQETLYFPDPGARAAGTSPGLTFKDKYISNDCVWKDLGLISY